MEIKSGSKTEENNFEMKLSDFEPNPKQIITRTIQNQIALRNILRKIISTKKKKRRRLLISLQAKKNAKKT